MVQAISVLASSLGIRTHTPQRGGCWVVPSSSRVLFFVTVRPWCLSLSMSSDLGVGFVSAGLSRHHRCGALRLFPVAFSCSSSPLSTCGEFK